MYKLLKFRFLGFAVAVLLFISGCAKQKEIRTGQLKVGFDVDDTLLFSTPAFKKGFESKAAPYSTEFWKVVNGSDREKSVIKKKARQLLIRHKKKGDEVFVITARHPYGGENLKEFLNEKFGILKEKIYFETEGKTRRIKQLELDIFYGDSDSDITAAQEAGAIAYRIQRSTASSYRKKYNPGKFGEEVIEDSQW